MIFKKTALSLMVIYGVLTGGMAYAGGDYFSWSGHHLIAHKSYINDLSKDQKMELHRYLNYEHREPCQNYRDVPHGFSLQGCELIYGAASTPREQLGKVVKTYTLYFEFDSSALTNASKSTLAKISRQIQKHDPDQVTVSGYTDTSGPSDYNKALSKRRAASVSKALNSRGVVNEVLKSRALGENNLAIRTNDNVRRAENRRVVVEFRDY